MFMELMAAAKDFLLVYFPDGSIKQPEHFDRDILGVDSFPAVMEILSGKEPAWNKSIFCEALGQLVEEGKIMFWMDEGGCKYQFGPGRCKTHFQP
jgi:hypothetical protein